MSLKASSWAWEQAIPGTQKLVLLALADYAGRDNASAWPSVATLAERCSIAERTVRRSLEALEAAKLICVEARPNKTNVYELVGLTGQDDRTMRSPRPHHAVTVTPCQNDTPCQDDRPVRSPRPPGAVTVTPEPIRNRKEPVIYSEMAQALYDVYPRKINRAGGLKAITAALKREAAKKDLGMSFNAMLEKTKLWATACEQKIAANPDDVKFVKHPATWFNQQCYLDDSTEWGIKPKTQSWQDREADQAVKRYNALAEQTLKDIESL